MRELLEAVKAYDHYRDQTVLIHRNPSSAALASLFKKFPGGLRGVISERGLWVWDAELLHDDAAEQAGIKGIRLYLLPDMVQIKGEDYFDENLAKIRQFDTPLRAAYETVPYQADDGEYM